MGNMPQMPRGPKRVFLNLLLLATLGASHWTFGASPCARDLMALNAPSPVELRVGIADVHTYKVGRQRFPHLVSVYTPASLDPSTKIWDFQILNFSARLPKQFVMSDGGVFGAFYYFDLRPGSALRLRGRKYLKALRTEFSRGNSGDNFEEFVIQSLRQEHLFQEKLFFKDSLASEMRSNARVGADAEKILKDFLNRPFTGPNPIISKNSRASLSFLAVFDPVRELKCFEKSWIASLILEEAKIPHRLRFGQSSLFDPSSPLANIGHVIVELGDGRLLDVEWNTVTSGTIHPRYRDWRLIDAPDPDSPSLWWSPYQHYPGLIIEP